MHNLCKQEIISSIQPILLQACKMTIKVWHFHFFECNTRLVPGGRKNFSHFFLISIFEGGHWALKLSKIDEKCPKSNEITLETPIMDSNLIFKTFNQNHVHIFGEIRYFTTQNRSKLTKILKNS